MVAVRRPLGLTDDLTRLAASLEALELRGSAAVAGFAATRDRLVSVIRSYLIPRIDNPDEPLLVVVAGPTGSGKSTLVNTLAGLDLSLTGPMRPTTTVPLVLTRAARHEAGMSVGGVECVVRTGLAPILEHMSLIDTPDIDSTSVEHRVVAEILIDHADIVMFVTSALRYADNVPWEVLRRALSRGTTVIPVLNRVGAESGAALLDFRALLSA
ncbi:MAG TPA: GTPase, partial [Acidimicrobiia bacterium]